MTTPQTILISPRTWQEFIRHFPDAAQWLVLQANLPIYSLPSLTPNAELATLVVPEQKEIADVHSGIG